jgi:glutaminyl-peptide cyclotransferase
MMVRYLTLVILVIALLAGGAAALAQTGTPEPATPTTPPLTATATPEPPPVLVAEVLEVYPHATDAYTQGLLLADGQLYESTGQRGQSSVRLVDLESGEVLQKADVDATYFAEGLALVDDRLIQITWQAETALVYDRDTFEQVGTFDYSGEGWGLCYDGESLYMSDGSGTITRRDPDTFEALDTVEVTLLDQPIGMFALQGQRIDLLNEMECVGEEIYVNAWQTDLIIRFDKHSGAVTGLIDASQLLTDDERLEVFTASTDNVLNGIAYDAENDEFLLTGKRWPKLFRVVFVPYEGE